MVPHFFFEEFNSVGRHGAKVVVFLVEHCSIRRRPDMAGLSNNHFVLYAFEIPFIVYIAEVTSVRCIDRQGIP